MTRTVSPWKAWQSWNDLALKTGEMMLASASVIGHRSARMATATVPPSSHDQQEFDLMGREKVEAAQESAMAGGMAMLEAGPAMAFKAYGQMWAVSRDMASLAMSTSPAQLLARQAQLTRTLMNNDAADLAQAAVRVTGKMMGPLHSRATANAKRLGRPKV